MRRSVANVNSGTTQIKNLGENMGALDIQLLGEEIAEIQKVVDAAEVHGARYPDGFTAETYRDSTVLVQ
jgi:aryl-alcohol dehydrogenase-like predicted oxidoreductase